MASSSSHPDTLVTLKVNYEGSTRRCKFPLRDMVASTLEEKLRAFLNIPQGTDCLFERYSDSAAAYIVLDPSNHSVYKQLYRAAKAKQKLKLRVTNQEHEERMAPRPVTIEDVPEPSASSSRLPETPVEPASVSPVSDASDKPRLRTTMDLNMSPEEARIRYFATRWQEHRDNRVRLSSLLNGVPVIRGPYQRDSWFADAARPDDSTNVADDRSTSPVSTLCPATGATFAVCCNSCDKTIPDSHYHCSTCDDGDFDLCQACVDQGITCYGSDHWLIKRVIKSGQIVNSTTETIAPKLKPAEPKPEVDVEAEPRWSAEPAKEPLPSASRVVPIFNSMFNIRTCNSCVQELPEHHFLHCTACPDYDLCKACFAKNDHGHHPKHGFVAAVEGTALPDHISAKLSPGRNQTHNAICDGCDKFIFGVRHKCLDCPDWDYCGDCVVNAGFIHPNHRFVPIFDALSETGIRGHHRPVHFGICCDGPLCTSRIPSYITGIRYKCAVCNDTDFCANCEASPSNTHNKTHPLIKFKTPVRNVSVTTTGEHQDGQKMPTMGDKTKKSRTSSRSTSTTAATIAATNVQTVVDVKPSEPVFTEPEAVVVAEKEIKKEEPEESKPIDVLPKLEDLSAVYVRDTVTDGTVLPPNNVFEQTWVLRNAGSVDWPAGCSVKFVGGDYMGHVDSSHPAGISELVATSESTVCYAPLAPGQEFPFTVLLRTPAREGKIISYWRLTTKDGFKFGHRLWCDVKVKAPKVEEAPKAEVSVAVTPKKELSSETLASSQMVFPKLDKESPVASVHSEAEPETTETHQEAEPEDFDDCEDDEWDASDDGGFMTDEEYDILDASDDDFVDQHPKPAKK